MQNNEQPEIGYILKEYPRNSETFILNEIHLLEQMGLTIHVLSVKRPTSSKRHRVVELINAAVTYLPEVTSVTDSPFSTWLRVNLPHFWPSHRELFRLRPKAYLQTLLHALHLSFKNRSSLWPSVKKAFYKDFLRAGYIALAVLQNGRIRHLHGHFCHGSTTMTMFASQLTGIPYSFTAHAKDIYLAKLNPGDLLPTKMARAEFVVTCTDANRVYLEALNESDVPIHTIYHGLDTSLFAPVGAAGEQEMPTILAVGRFVAKKGFPYLVRACHLLRQRGIAFQCVIVGEEEEDTPVVQELIAKLQLEEVITVHRAVTQERLRQIYADCTVMALPCQITADGDRDGIPNVLVEAMAMGIPVVSTTVSGIPELIDHGVNGLLVPQKDAEALADALEELLGDATLRRLLGQAARQKVTRRFDSRQTTVALKRLFEQMLDGRQPTAGSLERDTHSTVSGRRSVIA
jgi:glycosyltransferase involved in cell wall biosynthesis